MSSLYKLSICGIRSFSPKEHETIQFGSPLTLICGQNGCGKTTIIESLKYATTGDLPPNSKGGAFVNDPAIADRLVVNAEIKLGFTSVDGKLMTVTRNMQLTRKRGRTSVSAGNAFKSLEGQLAVHERGEKTAVSTKNAELDTRVPLYLGASKAVLEYVIFCHQDDSLWPLSEAGVLKKRFDEIFEALRFTRVLDVLKVMRKDMAADIRVIEQSVSHAKSDLARASKVREKVSTLVTQAEEYLLEIADLTMHIEQLEQRADALFRSGQAFQQTLSEHERLRLLVELTEASLRRLETSATILRDSDDSLLAMAANFEAVKAEKLSLLESVRESVLNLDTKVAATQESFHALVRDEGLLAGKKLEYLAGLEDLVELKKKVFPSNPAAGELDNDRVANVLLSEKENAASLLRRTRTAGNEEREAARASLLAASDSLRKEEERLSYCKEESSSTAAKLRTVRANLAAVAVNEETLEIEKSLLDAVSEKIALRKANLGASAHARRLDEETHAIGRLEHELEDLMRQIQAANKLSDLLSKIELLRESRTVKRAVLNKFLNTHGAAFSRIFATEIEPATAEKLVDNERRKRSEAYAQTQAESSALKSALGLAEAAATAIEKNLTSLKISLLKHSSNVLAVLTESEILEYENLIQELEEDYKTAVYNLNTFEVTKAYKVKAMELAKTSKCCALCNRAMDDMQLQTFVADIENNVKNFTADKLNCDVENTLKDLSEMKAINVDVLEYRRLTAEIDRLETERKDVAGRVLEAKSKFDVSSRATEESLNLLSAIETLSKPVSDIYRMSEELRGLESQISDLESELSELGVSSVSMSELQKQQQQKNFEIRNLRQSVADAIEDANTRQKELSKLEYQLKEKELLISKLQLSLSESTSMKLQINELETQESTLKMKAEELQKLIIELQDQRDLEKSKLEQVEDKCTQAESEKQKLLDEASLIHENFNKTFERILHFEQVDAALVAKNEMDVSNTRQRLNELISSKKELENEASELQAFINDATSTERNIRDNLELRDTEHQLQKQQAALADMDIANAEREKEQYQEKSKELREQIAGLNEQHYGKIGEVKQIKDQILNLQNELQTDFKDVDKHYHKEWIKLQTNLLVSADLQTYSQALDNAIMRYHSMKMDEINRILRELWTQTYRGTDIDGIEIKCDVTNQTKGRSYNYRVVMYKRSSELDMRGRCSAGQKVLTSILIRLALAECFGSNCGMIALDEPTTNLDVENAESLANALSNIIDFRKTQKNFQLIVITHDEKFLNHINGGRFVDNFYRIERDEKQHSIIKSLPIHVMQGE